MVGLITVFVFVAVTQPILFLLVGMAVSRRLGAPEWHPSEYQPMQMLMERQAALRTNAEAKLPELERVAA